MRTITQYSNIVGPGHPAFEPLKGTKDNSLRRVMREETVRKQGSLYKPIVKTNIPHL